MCHSRIGHAPGTGHSTVTGRGQTNRRLVRLISRAAAILSALIFAGLVFWPGSSRSATVASVKYEWSYTATPPSDLIGFVIKVGTTSGQYTITQDVTPGTVRTLTVANPSADGKYYAVIMAKDAAGNLSAPSNEVVFTIDTAAPPAPTNFTVTITYSVTVP